MKNKSIYLFFIVLLTISCNDSKITDYIILREYLKTVHQLDIDNFKLYVFISDDGCKKCISIAKNDLIKILTQNDNLSIAVIRSGDSSGNNFSDGKLKIYRDSQDEISRRAIRISGITLIKIKDEKLKYYYILDEKINKDEIERFFRN